MFTINYKDPRPIYEQVKQGLQQMMLSGAIPPGGRLPSVRELAVSLAINPNTIQRAYREMEAEGMIVSVPGKGSFAPDNLDPVKAAQEALFAELDNMVKKLNAAGIGTEEICARVRLGGVET